MPSVEGGSPEGGRRIVTVTNPLSADHSVLRPALVGSLVQVVSTNIRHGTDDVVDLRDRQGLWLRRRGRRLRRDRRRVVAARPGRDRRGRAGVVGPARRARTTSTTPRVRSSLLARRLGIGTSRIHAADGRAASPRGAGGAASGHRVTVAWPSPAGVGELHPSIAEAWDLRGARGRRHRARRFRSRRWWAAGAVVAAAPSRQPAAERDLAVVVAGEPPGRRCRRHDPGERRAGARIGAAVRHLPRRAARHGREEPGVPVDVPGAGSDARRGGDRPRHRDDHARDRGGGQRSDQDLSPVATVEFRAATLWRASPAEGL